MGEWNGGGSEGEWNGGGRWVSGMGWEGGG